MSDRLQFWFGTLGSAALLAFLATCLEAPRVATYACDSPSERAEERCVLTDTQAGVPPAPELAVAGHDTGRESRARDAGRHAVN